MRTATRILTTLCILASTLAAPAEEAAEEEEESSPHRVRVWAGAKGWHLRWDTSNERAVFEGDVVLRGPGHFDAAYAVGADSTRLRIEAAPRRVQFRARYAGTSQGLDLDASGAAISLRITIDGLEDREAVFLGREGDRHPPGFPFLLPTERDPLRAEPAPTPILGQLSAIRWNDAKTGWISPSPASRSRTERRSATPGPRDCPRRKRPARICGWTSSDGT